ETACVRRLCGTTGDKEAAWIMSKRALVLLIGVVVIGNVEALAVAPPQIVDPGDEKFEQKPHGFEPWPKSVEPQPNGPATRPAGAPADGGPSLAQPAAASEPSANPLWAIPLRQLTATRERPPFSPSRRPRAALAAKPPPAPAPPPKPAEPEKPQ